MDNTKVGQFILAERKEKKLTQAKLAERIFVSEKTISKWENGNGIPDTNTLIKLCEIFDCTINEILNGERLSSKDYVDKAEERLLELKQTKEIGDKRLLTAEIVIGILSAIILLSFTLIASIEQLQVWVKILLIILGFILGFLGFFFAIRIEQIAGYFVCKNCQHKYVPTYTQVVFSPHINRTRYMKCPHCKQKSWCKKVVK